MKALQIDRAVDGNLKPIKDSDGTLTALEISTDNVRIKNLDVVGDITIIGDITITGDINIAGVILGYTCIGLDEAVAQYNLTIAYAVPTSEFNVTFTAPPSGNVEINASFQFYAGSTGAGDVYVGLSDNATYNALEDFHEKVLIDQSGRCSIETISHSWTLTGLSAGAHQYWFGIKSTSTSGTPKLYYGADATGRYPDFIMKAIALPATIAT